MKFFSVIRDRAAEIKTLSGGGGGEKHKSCQQLSRIPRSSALMQEGLHKGVVSRALTQRRLNAWAQPQGLAKISG